MLYRFHVNLFALPANVAANHPIVLDQLVQLTEDDDDEIAAAAARSRDRLAESPPPLRFITQAKDIGVLSVKTSEFALTIAAPQREMPIGTTSYAHAVRRFRPTRRNSMHQLAEDFGGREPPPFACVLRCLSGYRDLLNR